MKNSEIHTGLPESVLRDFFAKKMAEIFDRECANKTETIPYDKEHPFEWTIKDAEAKIEYYKRLAELAREKLAVITLIKERGWSEHDVSDDTEKDLSYKLQLCFIGTDDEHEKLMYLINGV